MTTIAAAIIGFGIGSAASVATLCVWTRSGLSLARRRLKTQTNVLQGYEAELRDQQEVIDNLHKLLRKERAHARD